MKIITKRCDSVQPNGHTQGSGYTPYSDGCLNETLRTVNRDEITNFGNFLVS